MSPIYSHERREAEWRKYKRYRPGVPWGDVLQVLMWVLLIGIFAVALVTK